MRCALASALFAEPRLLMLGTSSLVHTCARAPASVSALQLVNSRSGPAMAVSRLALVVSRVLRSSSRFGSYLLLTDTRVFPPTDEPSNHLDLKALLWLTKYVLFPARASCWNSVAKRLSTDSLSVLPSLRLMLGFGLLAPPKSFSLLPLHFGIFVVVPSQLPERRAYQHHPRGRLPRPSVPQRHLHAHHLDAPRETVCAPW